MTTKEKEIFGRYVAVGAVILVAGCLTGSLLAAAPLGMPRAAAEMAARAADPAPLVRRLALVPRPAQEQDVGELIDRLGAAGARERALAACRIGRLSSRDVRRAIPALAQLLGDATPVEGRLCRDEQRWREGGWDDSSPGREAALALEEAGSAAVEPVLDVLADPAPRRREHAALALGLLEDRRAVEPLGGMLRDDEDARARARAAWALGMIEHADGVPPLSRALRDDPDAVVRQESAWGLGMIEHPDGVPALGEAIDDADFEVREQAAWALGMIESPSGVDPLVIALEDEEPAVREQAAWGLGMIESPRGVEGLVRVLGDTDPEVREQAAWALGMIESSRATPSLIEALADEDAEVRKQVAWALGMIEDPSAADALVDALDDEDPEVRKQAMWALTKVMDEASFGEIDPHELAETLRRALRDGGGG